MDNIISIALGTVLLIAGLVLQLRKFSHYLARKHIVGIPQWTFEKLTKGDSHQRALESIERISLILIIFGSWLFSLGLIFYVIN